MNIAAEFQLLSIEIKFHSIHNNFITVLKAIKA